MEERRGINRVDYRVKSVIVTCDTFEKFYVDAINVSPLGMGLLAPAGTPNLVGRQIIIVADTLIMNADVLRDVFEEWCRIIPQCAHTARLYRLEKELDLQPTTVRLLCTKSRSG